MDIKRSNPNVEIAVAIVIAAFIFANAFKAVKSSNEVIEVTGSARMSVESDFAVWNGSIAVKAGQQGMAVKKLEKHIEKFASLVSETGIEDEALVIKPVRVHSQNQFDNQGRMTGNILYYEARREFTVRSNNIDLLEKLTESVSGLMAEGLPLDSYGLSYYYSKLDDARVNLMSAATEDAKARAIQIASAAGDKVGSIRKARMGVIQVVQPQSTNISDYGMYDTSTRFKDIVAVVKVSFAIR